MAPCPLFLYITMYYLFPYFELNHRQLLLDALKWLTDGQTNHFWLTRLLTYFEQKNHYFFYPCVRSCQRNPTNIGQPFFTGILGIFYAKPLHINRCLTWNDPSLCDVLYWFGIWSPPLAFFLFFRAFFFFFFSIYYYLWPSSIVKRWINPPRFISSRNSVRFWRSASVPVVVVTPEDPRPEPKGLHWTSPAFRQGVNPTLMSTWRQRLTMPFPIRLKSASTRSASTLKCSALHCGVNFNF